MYYDKLSKPFLRVVSITISLIVEFGLVFLLIGCLGGGNPVYNPFYIPKENFESQVKKLAFTGVYLMYNAQDKATASKVISTTESQIVDFFNKSGKYKIIPPSETGPVEKEIMEQFGFKSYFVFNQREKSSTFDMDRMLTVIKELKKRLNIDAILRVEYVRKWAALEDDKASWDGVQEKYIERGKVGRILASQQSGRGHLVGNVPAISLKTSIIDEEQILWQDYGGVGLTKTQHWLGKEKELSPLEIYFVGDSENPMRISRAVNIAFRSLVPKR